MIDYRLRRPASEKRKQPDVAARVSQIVGTNLREARRSRGYSLDTLAAASGVSRAMLGQIETGKSVPTITVLWKVAAALGVPVAQFIADPDETLYTVTRRPPAGADDGREGPAIRRALGPANGQPGYVLEELRIAKGHSEAYPAQRDGGSMTAILASGAVEIVFGEEPPVALSEGDAVHFSATLKYSISNNGSCPAILYLAAGFARNGK
ncbi:MAG: helix-turn-helix domain-containing protein [Deltaproteobacteria bacterium]